MFSSVHPSIRICETCLRVSQSHLFALDIVGCCCSAPTIGNRGKFLKATIPAAESVCGDGHRCARALTYPVCIAAVEPRGEMCSVQVLLQLRSKCPLQPSYGIKMSGNGSQDSRTSAHWRGYCLAGFSFHRSGQRNDLRKWRLSYRL